jgi:hypothetical protein
LNPADHITIEVYMRKILLALSLILTCVLPSQAQGGGVTYRQAGEATLHYKDGVTVRRHADGSCEVSDPETVEPLYPNQSVRRPARRAVRKAVAKRKATTAAKPAAQASSTAKVATAKKAK